jgi:ABC-type transport system substrate-binding protein
MIRQSKMLLVPLILFALLIHGINPATGTIQKVGQPRLDEIYMKALSSYDAIVQDFRACGTDMISLGYNWTYVSQLLDEQQTLLTSTRFHYCHIDFNCRSYVPNDAEQPDAGRELAPLNWSSFRQSLTWAGLSCAEKEAAILEIFGGPVAVPDDSPVPVSLGVWHWEPPAIGCNFTKAWEILEASGFYIAGNVLCQPNGVAARDTIEVLSPNASAGAPSSSAMAFAQKWVDKWNDFFDNFLGVTNCNFVNNPVGMGTLYPRAFTYRNFDAYFQGWALGRFPDYLYDFFHSSQDYPDSVNAAGLADPELDSWLETIKYSMIYQERLQACYEAQQKLILELCPSVYVYSRNYHSAFKNYTYYQGQLKWLENMINLAGFGADNPWTWGLMHWNTAPTGGKVNFSMYEYNAVSNLHPGQAGSMMELSILEKVTDSLTRVDLSNNDLPWIAVNWTVKPFVWEPLNVVNGMQLTLQIRNGVLWHDLMPVTVEDIKFALSFMANFPQYEYLSEYLLWSEVTDPFTIDVYINTTEQWPISEIEYWALKFPKHIYDPGGWLEQHGYDPVTAEVWNIDYGQGEARKALVGCGPYVFDYWNATTNTAHLVKFQNYWVDGPIKVSIITPQRVDPNTIQQYYVEIINTGSEDSLTGEFAPAVIDGVEVLLDSNVIKVIPGLIVVQPFSYVKLGPFNVQLGEGFHYLHCRAYCYGEQYDSYSCPLWVTPDEDVNGDMYVGIDDIFSACVAFGAEPLGFPYSERWDERCDINGDHYIGIDDIFSIAVRFGWDA